MLNLKQKVLGNRRHNSDLQYDPYKILVNDLLLKGAVYLGAGLGLCFMLWLLRKE